MENDINNIPMDKELGSLLEFIQYNEDNNQNILLLCSYMINVGKHPGNRIVCLATVDLMVNGMMEEEYTEHDLLIRSALMTPHILS